MKSAVTAVLNRKWMLPIPDAQIHQIFLSSSSPVQGQGPRQPPAPPVLGNICFSNHMNPSFGGGSEENYIMGRNGGCQSRCFYVVRDDLLHPLVNGNKARKLDALLPLLLHLSVTDVVTCGGCQSAHAAAVAVSCAERGLRPHLLLRGEQPEVLTGYNLVSTLYGDVTYVPRSLYANRESMLMSHADLVAGDAGHVLWCSDIHDASFSNRLDACVSAKYQPTRKVVIVNEGAGDAVALLGFIRLVGYLSQNHLFGKERPVKLVVDAGTGTTAIGLGLGVLCLGLPWKVVAVMLADTIDAYRQKEKDLISNFRTQFDFHLIDQLSNEGDCTLVDWIERPRPRKFGNILEGETETCQRIARQTGILVDPVYTLATWEVATQLCMQEIKDVQVLMLHTGGTLGMFGLAQRYKSYFRVLKEV